MPNIVGNRLPCRVQRGSRFCEPLRDDRLDRLAGERRPAGQHLVEHTAEGVDVAAAIERGFPSHLFRAHVRGGAQQGAGLGENLSAGLPQRLSDAEVGDHRHTIVDHDVFRLDVPVDNVLPVGVVEGAGNVPCDLESVL